jgi:hypothetical protein
VGFGNESRLKTRKLLISRNSKNAKIGTCAEVRYTAGTQTTACCPIRVRVNSTS